MALCERCQCQLDSTIEYPAGFTDGERSIVINGEKRYVREMAWNLIGVLWPLRDMGFTASSKLREMLWGNQERADSGVRDLVWQARTALEGTGYEIVGLQGHGYRMRVRGRRDMAA